MTRSRQELLFDFVVALAAGLAYASVMLGLGGDPVPILLFGIGVVVAAVMTVVPQSARVPAGVTGVLGVMLAGFVVPNYAVRAVRPSETLELSLLLAGLVLLLTFALLRVTTFTNHTERPA